MRIIVIMACMIQVSYSNILLMISETIESLKDTFFFIRPIILYRVKKKQIQQIAQINSLVTFLLYDTTVQSFCQGK